MFRLVRQGAALGTKLLFDFGLYYYDSGDLSCVGFCVVVVLRQLHVLLVC